MNEDKSLVSAIITTHARPMLVRRAIRSTISQSYDRLEIIVVEDGSDCGVQAWLDEKGLSHIHYVRHPKALGLASARNTGWRLATGKYVAYLDDDDEWLPEKLARQVKLAEIRSCAVISCGALILASDGSVMGTNQARLRGDIRAEIGRMGLYTVPSSCLFLRTALEQVGGYDERITSHVDHGIWMKMAEMEYKADYVEDCLVKVYVHFQDRMTTRPLERIQATGVFINRWKSDWEKWFGQSWACDYGYQFSTRVFKSLIRDCMGCSIPRGLYCYGSIVAHMPSRFQLNKELAIYTSEMLVRRTFRYPCLRVLWKRATVLLGKTAMWFDEQQEQ
jgi:glycosyltransferase involved in cell wall biosynthesis